MVSKELQQKLQHHGYLIVEERSVPYGIKYKLGNGATVTCFDNGNIQVQGKAHIKDAVESALGAVVDHSVSNPLAEGKNFNKVFVVYGHDKESRDQLEAMLRRWRLDPLILDQLPSGGQTIIEKLENYTGQSQFGIVLATPDDVGYRKDHEDEKAYRARQNVVLELGMLLAKLGREKVAIVRLQRSWTLMFGVIYKKIADLVLR